jgi:hypothetical protein
MTHESLQFSAEAHWHIQSEKSLQSTAHRHLFCIITYYFSRVNSVVSVAMLPLRREARRLQSKLLRLKTQAQAT